MVEIFYLTPVTENNFKICFEDDILILDYNFSMSDNLVNTERHF